MGKGVLIVKEKKLYTCEICNTDYANKEKAKQCEERHKLLEKATLIGRVGEPVDELPSDTPVQKPSVDIEALKKEIVAKRNALSPLDKKAMKEKLEKAGLPIAYKNVTDPNVLQQVLDCFE